MLSVDRPGRARAATHGATAPPPRPSFSPRLADGGAANDSASSSSSSSSSSSCIASFSPSSSSSSLSSSTQDMQLQVPQVTVRKPPPPPPEDEAERPRTRLSLESSTDALQGRRDYMEDLHISIDDLTRHYTDLLAAAANRGLPNALYGIYDGHVGKRASTFVSDTLHDRICQNPAFAAAALTLLGGDAGAGEGAGEHEGGEGQDKARKVMTVDEATEAVVQAMEAGFLQTDKEFLEDAVRPENMWRDGTTAVVALVLGSRLFIANLGDSEAVLGKRTYNRETSQWEHSFEVLSQIHKPTVPSEQARIEKEGGFVIGGRVGGLSISRSFGDRNMKLPIEEDGFWHGVLVDPHPYVMHRQLTSTDWFVLLGCDGVWEKWSHEDSVAFVFEKLDEGLSVDELTEAVTRRAHAVGSQDNISATLLLFSWSH